MITLYGMSSSGNCYKLQLACAQLGIEHAWEEIDITRGENLSPEFLAMNDRGKVPVLKLDDGRTMSESNAILNYLAQGSALLPDDRWERAKVLQWLFFEQYSHEPYVAVARFIQLYQGMPEARREEYEVCHVRGHKAFRVMEQQLQRTPYLVGEQYTLADIALYAYTHVAHEGGFVLSGYPAINAWLARIASHPRHVTMFG